MKTRSKHPGNWAFSLLELMISMSIGALILAALVSSTIAMQKLFVATDQYYMATSDQMRVLDFIALDMRRAVSGTVSNSAQTLTLNLPDYIDYTQSPPAPRRPSITATGTVVYSTSANQPTVSYSISGSAPNQVVQRTFTGSDGTVVVTTLTAAAANYQVTFFDPSNPGGTAGFSIGGPGQPSKLTAQITFAPRFNRLNLTSSRQGTTASMTMLMRNHQ